MQTVMPLVSREEGKLEVWHQHDCMKDTVTKLACPILDHCIWT